MLEHLQNSQEVLLGVLGPFLSTSLAGWICLFLPFFSSMRWTGIFMGLVFSGCLDLFQDHPGLPCSWSCWFPSPWSPFQDADFPSGIGPNQTNPFNEP